MTISSAYTEKTLATYMHTKLGNVASLLSFTVGSSDAGDYEEAVNETLLAYGTTDITSISGTSNLTKLRVLARVQAWQMAVDNLAAFSRFSADGGTYDRNQLYEQAKKNLDAALTEAYRYDPNYQITRRKADAIHDPYQVRTSDERAL